MSEWTDILDNLAAYLRWRQECGGRSEMFDPAVAKAFLVDVGPRPAVVAAVVSPAAMGHVAPAPVVRPGVSARTVAAVAADADPEARRAALAAIAQQVAACRLCPLCEQRTKTVPGQGNPLSPDILFIGEAPGADEDRQGLAFVGAAGQLLTKMIAAMGYTRDDVFIANICKCRPPNNRQPALNEMQACFPYLRAQIAIIRPRVIVALGATAVKGLLDSSLGISKLRGTWTSYMGIPLMPTYHPAYLLRLPPAKHEAWEDLKKVLLRLGRPVPEKKKPDAPVGA